VAGRWLSSGRLDDGEPKAPLVDTTVAHIARVYDYWLGGKDNFAVDRIAAERVIAAYPGIVRSARGNRAFLGRAVRYLVCDAGSASSWTSAPVCPPRTTRTRSPRGGAAVPGGVRGQRPGGAVPRHGTAGERAGGCHGVRRRRPARPGDDPGRGGGGAGFLPPGGPHAGSDLAAHQRPGRSVRDRARLAA